MQINVRDINHQIITQRIKKEQRNKIHNGDTKVK